MEKTWDEIWRDFKGLNFFGKRVNREFKNTIKKICKKIGLSLDAKIIDVGCGTGATLSFFRDLGYTNSIGIDVSKNALNLCNSLFNFIKDKDVFLMNASKTNFNSNTFDLVFSAGLLEHFQNSLPIVNEMCRISKKWILLFQPNSAGLFKKIINFFAKFKSMTWEREYYYIKEDYIELFQKFNFSLNKFGFINFREFIWLLFKKNE